MENTQRKRRFELFMDMDQTLSDILPLAHTTTSFSFADICEGDNIKADKCKYFKKDIVYLFFGRPAYRVEESVDSELEFNWPIVFILHPEMVKSIQAVYPFDTGAFYNEIYAKFFSRRSNVDDYRLPGHLDSARKLVSRFYGSASKYLFERSTKNLDIPHMQFEAQGVHALSRLPAQDTKRDERSSSIEVQVAEDIDIRKSVMGLILPQQYLAIKEVVEALERWDIQLVKYYDTISFFGAESRIGQIYPIIKQAYIDLGYLCDDDEK